MWSRSLRSSAFLAALFCANCSTAGGAAASEPSAPPARPGPRVEPAEGERVAVTGVRLSQGTAVDCPTIRDDAGTVHVVSHLPPAIPVGGRVSAQGVRGVTTHCLGEVIIVEAVRPEAGN
jgi:hypothetical protein